MGSKWLRTGTRPTNSSAMVVKASWRRTAASNRRLPLLSLQLLQNCLMLINTILIQRTIDRQGLWARLQPADFRALTPLFYGHINPYGLFELDLEGPSLLEAA